MREVHILSEINEFYRSKITEAALGKRIEEADIQRHRIMGQLAVISFPTDRPLNSSSFTYPDGSMRDEFGSLVQLYSEIQKIINSTYGEHCVVDAQARPNKAFTKAAILGRPKPGSATQKVLHDIEEVVSGRLDAAVAERLANPVVAVRIDQLVGKDSDESVAERLGRLCMRINHVLQQDGNAGRLPLQRPKVREFQFSTLAPSRRSQHPISEAL